MFMEQDLDCTPDPNVNFYEVSKNPSEAEDFLKSHSMAKIIFIVDTHCFETGAFAWKKNDTPEGPSSGCSLLEVSTLHCLTYSVTLSSADPKGLLSQRGIQISFRCRGSAKPPPQEPYPEPHMWCHHLTGCHTK